MANILLVGETWIIQETHIKGFDSFSTSRFGEGGKDWMRTLEAAGHTVTNLPAHLVPQEMPSTVAALDAWDVVVLSDIGANSLAVPLDVWLGGRAPNALVAVRDWVKAGGALVMCGGYLSFAGIDGKGRYAETAVEEALPVTISAHDDRVENPEHNRPHTVLPQHPLASGVSADWGEISGYNRFTADADSSVVVTVGSDPFIVAGEYGAGRSLAFATDIGPHWAPDSFVKSADYTTFWTNAVDWLVAR
jgi:uncharacterized membrane protein